MAKNADFYVEVINGCPLILTELSWLSIHYIDLSDSVLKTWINLEISLLKHPSFMLAISRIQKN